MVAPEIAAEIAALEIEIANTPGRQRRQRASLKAKLDALREAFVLALSVEERKLYDELLDQIEAGELSPLMAEGRYRFEFGRVPARWMFSVVIIQQFTRS